jgi:hypothetical protein
MKRKRSRTESLKGKRLAVMAGVFLLLAGGHFSGCEPEDMYVGVNCLDCIEYQPDSTELIIYLTINRENESVPLTVYRGNAGGELFLLDTATGKTHYIMAAIGETYTVRAAYKSGDKTILAFDSDVMYLADYGAECGNPCYIVKGGIYDLELVE